MKNLKETIDRDGFVLMPKVIEAREVDRFTRALERTTHKKAAGIRDLLNCFPWTRAVAEGKSIRPLVDPILGVQARVVRAIYFDKNKDANWKVTWHQDLTIAVKKRIEVAGFSAWSYKASIQHVQPPVSILQNMLSVRLHLDDTDETNGALRVLVGSHRFGRLKATEITVWKQQTAEIVCSVPRGGVMLMKPLLLHASSLARNPSHRRVLHFEYSAVELPAGLEWYEA